MKIKVKGEAVRLPVDQWCEFLAAGSQGVHVRLEGDYSLATVQPQDIVGLRLSENIDLRLQVTGLAVKNCVMRFDNKPIEA